MEHGRIHVECFVRLKFPNEMREKEKNNKKWQQAWISPELESLVPLTNVTTLSPIQRPIRTWLCKIKFNANEYEYGTAWAQERSAMLIPFVRHTNEIM